MTMVATETVPRAKTDTLQLAVRIPREWLARLDALVPKIAQAGVQTTRTDAIRAALAKGLDALETQLGNAEREAVSVGDAKRRPLPVSKRKR
jgi:hypothetical protein